MLIEISVVIPVFNARHIVKASVDELINFLNEGEFSYEILLRDDCSEDGTMDELKNLEKRYPRLRCFRNDGNKGLGFTLRKMFEDARGRTIIYSDCDLPFGVEIISELFNGIKENDIVVASRYKGGCNDVPLIRKIMSRAYYFFCKMLFDMPVMDIGSGTVAIKKQVVGALDLRAEGFDIHAELYVKARRAKYFISEISADSRKIKESSFSIVKHGFSVIVKTIKLWFELRK